MTVGRGCMDGPAGTSAEPSTSNHSRVPFTSTCIPRSYDRTSGRDPRKGPQHEVQDSRAASRIELAEGHRRVVGIGRIHHERPLVERAGLELPLLRRDQKGRRSWSVTLTRRSGQAYSPTKRERSRAAAEGSSPISGRSIPTRLQQVRKEGAMHRASGAAVRHQGDRGPMLGQDPQERSLATDEARPSPRSDPAPSRSAPTPDTRHRTNRGSKRRRARCAARRASRHRDAGWRTAGGP